MPRGISVSLGCAVRTNEFRCARRTLPVELRNA